MCVICRQNHVFPTCPDKTVLDYLCNGPFGDKAVSLFGVVTL
jgi:hypothetical protein